MAGIPEVVEHGATGYCLPPTLPISDYPRSGGSIRGLPEFVYDPASDELVEPKLVDPELIGNTVMGLLDEPRRFEGMSEAATKRISAEFDFANYAKDLERFFADAAT